MADNRYEAGHDNRIILLKKALEQHLRDQSNPHGVSLASLYGNGDIVTRLNIYQDEKKVVWLGWYNKDNEEIDRVQMSANGQDTFWTDLLGDPADSPSLMALLEELEAEFRQNTIIGGKSLETPTYQLKNYNYSATESAKLIFKEPIDFTSFAGNNTLYEDENNSIIADTINGTNSVGIRLTVTEGENTYTYCDIDRQDYEANKWYKTGNEPIEAIPAPLIITPSALNNDLKIIADVDIIGTEPVTLETTIDNLQRDVNSKEPAINANHKINAEYIEGLDEQLTHYVTIDTAQTITAEKTFSNTVTFGGNNIKIYDNKIEPVSNNSGLIGTSDKHFNNAYINNITSENVRVTGNLEASKLTCNGVSGSKAVNIPNGKEWASDRLLATTEDIKDGTLTIIVDGQTTTFGANSDTNATVNITIPVKNVKVNGATVVDQNGIAEITIPSLTPYATKEELTELDSSLATVAKSGDYNDLSNTPDLSDVVRTSNTPGLIKHDGSIDTATYATVGQIPEVPIQEIKVNNVTVTPINHSVDIIIPDAQVQANWNETDTESKAYIQNKPTLATVATSGNYNDLDNKPTIPQVSIANNQITVDSVTLAYGTTGSNILVQTDNQGKLNSAILPDAIVGQMIYGGTVDFEDEDHVGYPYAKLSNNAKTKLGTSDDYIILTNDETAITGYVDNENIYYVCKNNGTFAGETYVVGDWILSTGSNWDKIENTDAVVSVNGQIGAVNLTPADIGLGKVENKSSADIRGEITASDVETALNYTPYSTSNPAGYITAEGVVKSVNGATPNAQGEVSITLPSVPITGIEVNGVAQSPVSGVVNISVPTIPTNVSSFTNDAGYITNVALTPYIEKSATPGFVKNDGSIDTNTYLTTVTIPITEIQVNGVSVSPSLGVVNITIPDQVIANTTLTPSATLTSIQVGQTVYEIPQGGGASYTAGNGININNNTISIDTAVVVTQINVNGSSYTPNGGVIDLGNISSGIGYTEE